MKPMSILLTKLQMRNKNVLVGADLNIDLLKVEHSDTITQFSANNNTTDPSDS